MIAVDAVQRTIILVKKFGLYAFVPLFLLIAYNYTSSARKQYRATAKIALRDVAVTQALSDLHSEYLVKETLDNLPFEASFYAADSPRTELYGIEVPIRLQFEIPRSMDAAESSLTIDVEQKNYAILNEDTSASHAYGEPVHESYGDFAVLRRPDKNFKTGDLLVEFENRSKQLGEYYNSLQVRTADDDKTLALSITTGNATKSAAFLYKLLKQYGGTAVDRHGDMINSKFTLIEKPENNTKSASLSPVWFYILALIAGLAIPLGVPVFTKKRRHILPRQVYAIPKFVDHMIQNGFVFRQAD
ncbi:MAG TPA: hypothetical protein VG367_19930 [Mucilaginibacter sp.]|jgi:hypothetical protein|nr:hypothetical protein [Mucilaginibacter sp.]